jgi:hypothetical protein
MSLMSIEVVHPDITDEIEKNDDSCIIDKPADPPESKTRNKEEKMMYSIIFIYAVIIRYLKNVLLLR